MSAINIKEFVEKRHQHIMQSPFEKYRMKLLNSLFKKSLNGIALDIGCNIGEAANSYSKNIKKAVLIDLDLFLLKCTEHFNRCLPNLFFVCADLVNLPFKDSIFDSVVLTEVIEHTPKEYHRKAIEELLRVSKKGCRIFISTPNRISLPALEGRFIKVFFKNYVWNAWDNTHQYIYSSREFIRFLPLKRLRIKKWIGYYFLPGSILIRLPLKLQKVFGYLSYLISKYLGRIFPFKYFGFTTIVELEKSN